jgi:hypothetical protein
MPHIVADRVKESTTTTGSGTITLGGAATGFRAFSAVAATGDTTFYCIQTPQGAEWEVGLGTLSFSGGSTLARTSVIASSNAGAAVVFSAGTKEVFITQPAVGSLWGSLTPSQLAADANDYAPAGLAFASVLRMDADQIRNITGLTGGYDGRVLTIRNVGTGADSTLVIKRENASSAAANRFSLTEDVCIDPGGRAVFQYDGTASRWRLMSPPAVSGASLRMIPFISTDFLGAAGAGTMEAHLPWDFAVIASGTQSKTASEANHPGIHRITSSTTTNSGGYVMTDIVSFLIGGGEVAEFVFRIIDLTTITVRLGFHDTLTSTDAVDGCYIEIPSTGAAVGKTSNNSVRTTSATIATLSINTWYRARVEINDAASSAIFTIFDANGNQLGQQTNSANIPTGAGRNCGHGVVATKSGTTAQACIELDYMSVEFDKALVR